MFVELPGLGEQGNVTEWLIAPSLDHKKCVSFKPVIKTNNNNDKNSKDNRRGLNPEP